MGQKRKKRTVGPEPVFHVVRTLFYLAGIALRPFSPLGCRMGGARSVVSR